MMSWAAGQYNNYTFTVEFSNFQLHILCTCHILELGRADAVLTYAHQVMMGCMF